MGHCRPAHRGRPNGGDSNSAKRTVEDAAELHVNLRCRAYQHDSLAAVYWCQGVLASKDPRRDADRKRIAGRWWIFGRILAENAG
jgi:hypothetical protein